MSWDAITIEQGRIGEETKGLNKGNRGAWTKEDLTLPYSATERVRLWRGSALLIW